MEVAPSGWRQGPLGRRWVRWTLAVGTLVLLVFYLFGYHVGGHSVCGGCKSFQHYDRVGFGNPNGEHVEIASWSWVSKSACYEGLFDETHQHTWFAGQFHIDSYRWGITCAMGNMRHNTFGQLYEAAGDFRDLVQEQIRRGEVSRETVRTIVEFPRYGPDRFLEETGHRPTPAEVALATEKAKQLTGEYVKDSPKGNGTVSFP